MDDFGSRGGLGWGGGRRVEMVTWESGRADRTGRVPPLGTAASAEGRENQHPSPLSSGSLVSTPGGSHDPNEPGAKGHGKKPSLKVRFREPEAGRGSGGAWVSGQVEARPRRWGHVDPSIRSLREFWVPACYVPTFTHWQCTHLAHGRVSDTWHRASVSQRMLGEYCARDGKWGCIAHYKQSKSKTCSGHFAKVREHQ